MMDFLPKICSEYQRNEFQHWENEAKRAFKGPSEEVAKAVNKAVRKKCTP